ncbi:MAG: hypothetical protein A2233_02175 [Candidatus Kerfeldbacteria bacterium RIFOXYA2_FULL_38_24]|uniref:Uncharacterized protein n=1 Tax=Candidatus Kerfeldbacteria bacterium RIFOXYB2_FULL_38_14 TaxID=1798547 RepID=A0A1G2BHG3_9BACT|nr:MAG: hypothetical protein A2319_04775 [Candidatus Kerfeldbacteria bacterium RIFOXYB2_FULL_38_14]OGY87920.1 MAG: hypothetical protein A2233_02175 [Candidatus Kerfeldbacteria bacterium RIFOXYA2_FULL_38_24]OGY88666.1 MAG: hypothetical protein A2458_03425 [Candidatus Kerfeldbacteria bacterium RIFOXYC2_FULL_38_9]
MMALLLILIATLEYRYNSYEDKKKKEEMKSHIVTGLISIVVILIVYFLFSALGPIFNLLFQS